MAHPQQLCFVRTLAEHFTDNYSGVKVLEIGSFDVNGTIRNYFHGSDYIGADLTVGPGVDLVSDGHLIDHDEQTYDITISCECFEHNPYWFETFQNMYRMAKDGGFVIFTCATRGRGEHGTRRTSPASSPGTQEIGWDYYQNLEERDFAKKFDFSRAFSTYTFLVNKKSRDLYFVGRKVGVAGNLDFHKKNFFEEYAKNQAAIEKSLKKTQSIRQRALACIKFVIVAPARLFILLPDREYQNLLIRYYRFIKIFKKT